MCETGCITPISILSIETKKSEKQWEEIQMDVLATQDKIITCDKTKANCYTESEDGVCAHSSLSVGHLIIVLYPLNMK